MPEIQTLINNNAWFNIFNYDNHYLMTITALNALYDDLIAKLRAGVHGTTT